MAIKFKGDMTKVVAKNKGDMSKTTLRKRASVIQQIINGTATITPAADYYTKMLLHFDDSITSSNGGTISSVFAPMQGVASPDGTKVYMGTWGSTSTGNGLHVIDVATNTKTTTISTPGTTIDHVVNSTGTRVYSTQYGTTSGNNNGSNVYVFDTTNNTLLATVPVGSGAHSVAISPDDKFVYVSTEITNKIYRIDTATLTPVMLTAAGCYSIEISPDGTKLFASVGGFIRCFSRDVVTGNLTYIKDVGGTYGGYYTSTKSGDFAHFISNNGFGINLGGVFSVSWDLSTEKAVSTANGSYSACVSTDGKKLFVSNNSGNSVSVIDTTSNKVIDTITGYSSPRGAVFAGNKLFVANNGAGNVPVVDMRTFSDSALSPMLQNKAGTVLASTTQSKFGGKSLALNGTNTNKLQFANPKGKAMDLSNKPFCVEGWFYLTSLNSSAGLVSYGDSDDTDYTGFHIVFNSNFFNVYFSSNGASWNLGILTTTTTPALNSWFHLALIRETVGGSIKLVYNGAVIGTLNTTSSLYTGNYMYIGKALARPKIDGYVDDFRVVVGSCPYSSSAFVVPTATLTATSDTKLLIKGSTTIKDDSTFNLYTQTIGSAASSTVQSKFGGSSIKIASATGDFIKVYNNTQPIAFLDRPFTIEGWFYKTGTGFLPVLAFANADSQGPSIAIQADGTFSAAVSTTGTSWAAASITSTTPSSNAWHHFALVRETKGGNIKLYHDGVLMETISTSAEIFTAETLHIGHYPYYYATNPYTFNGYIDEVRITLDQCKYNAAFTPPTAPFTLWGSETQPSRRVALDSNDVLAWNFDETTGTYLNRGTAGMLNLYPSTGAAISSAAGVFNNCAFNASTATYGLRTANTSLGESSGEFSASCWVKVSSWTNYSIILEKWYYATGAAANPYTSIAIGFTGNASLGEWYANVSTNGAQNLLTCPAGSRLSLNQWAHIGMTFSNGTLKMYKDGVLVGTLSGITGNIDWGTHGQWNVLGHPQESLANNRLNGYVDDVRVANVARDAAYFQSLYASGPNTASYSFAANTLPGLKVWYKADAITGVNDGAALTSWIDSSGNGKNLSGYGATYQRLGINGRPSVKIEGGDLTVVNAGTPVGSSAITVYSVVTPRTSGEIWGVGDNNQGRIGLWRTGVQLGIEGMGKSTAYLDAPSESPLVLSFPYAQGTNLGNNPVYINGISSGLGSNNSPINIGSQTITLGHIPGYGGYYANSDIAEILIYNTTHTTAERQQVEAYLAAKYGITVAT